MTLHPRMGAVERRKALWVNLLAPCDTLLEAKGPGYAHLLRQKFGDNIINKLLAQAGRQVAAAGGRQIVWHFAEQEAADAVIQALTKLGIKVVVTP